MLHLQFSLLCVTETWLNSNICDNEILPFRFLIYRKDRGSRSGVVMVVIKHSFSSFLIPSPPDLEVVSLAIQTTK